MSAISQSPALRRRASAPQVSSGRGGAGNMRSSSKPRGAGSQHATLGPEGHSSSKGREVPTQHSENQRFFRSGRGGVGNIHAPSRGAAIETRNALREEAEYVKGMAKGSIRITHGRGGAGNFSFLRFPSRSKALKKRPLPPDSPSRSKTLKKRPLPPEMPTGVATGVAVADAVNISRKKTSPERTAHGLENNRSSGISKITKLFRPWRTGRSKIEPKVS